MKLVLASGGWAEVVATDGNHVELRASSPSPPGSTLVGVSEGKGPPYRVKVRSCRRAPEGPPPVYRIEGRFVDLSREQRSALLPGPGS